MKHFLIICSIFCSYTFQASGQITPQTSLADTTNTEPLRRESDKEVNIKEIETYADKFIPRKASLYSAILPGLGQAYNKNYWKIPIIYGGFIALGYTVKFYDDQYREFRSDLFVTLEEGATTTPLGLTITQSRSLIDKARRERDFYMIMTGVLYLLQIAEAHIDAHLKEFKLNPELQVSIEPMIDRPQFTSSYSAGLSIKFKF